MLEQHEGWHKTHCRVEAALHQERREAGCKVGTEEMVGAPEKEYKEQVVDLILGLTLKKPIIKM